MRRARHLAALAAVALVAASCSDSAASETPSPASAGEGYAVQVASSDHYVDAPQRVQLGVVRQTPEQGVSLLTSGRVDVTLTPPTDAGTPVDGAARYIPAPGTQPDTGTPGLSSPDIARGVYQLDASFDVTGIWQAGVTFETPEGPVSVETAFPVLEEPALPAPGQPAIASKNLTADAPRAEAVDSRALDGAPIPDPELHADTIRGALADGRPVVALFATPVYCESQFCGPTTDALQAIAAGGPPDAATIHVEIWFDFSESQINASAAEWLLRDGDLTEPWLYLIDAGGTIVDRWSPLFDPDEVLAELDAL